MWICVCNAWMCKIPQWNGEGEENFNSHRTKRRRKTSNAEQNIYETLTRFFKRAKCHNSCYKLLQLCSPHSFWHSHSTGISNITKILDYSMIAYICSRTHTHSHKMNCTTCVYYTLTLHTFSWMSECVLSVVSIWRGCLLVANALGVEIHEVFHFHRCQLFVKHAKLHISPFFITNN